VPTAFIGELVHQARNRNHEIVRLFAGTDRVKGYESQIDRYKEQLNIDIKVDEIKRSDEDISATKVRNALIDDDWDTFKKMTAKLDKKDFIRLQNEIKSAQGTK
jgi:citrate lyase synthetase